jgi:hypothetical protein
MIQVAVKTFFWRKDLGKVSGIFSPSGGAATEFDFEQKNDARHLEPIRQKVEQAVKL